MWGICRQNMLFHQSQSLLQRHVNFDEFFVKKFSELQGGLSSHFHQSLSLSLWKTWSFQPENCCFNTVLFHENIWKVLILFQRGTKYKFLMVTGEQQFHCVVTFEVSTFVFFLHCNWLKMNLGKSEMMLKREPPGRSNSHYHLALHWRSLPLDYQIFPRFREAPIPL